MTQRRAGVALVGRVGRNGLFNLLRLGISVPVFLLLTPYMVRGLGEVGYGVWALVMATLAVTALGDLGISAALTRFVAVEEAENRKRLHELVNTAAGLYLAVALVGGLLLMLIHPWLLRSFFQVPPELLAPARTLLVGSLLAVLVNFVATAWYAVLPGLQRYAASNVVGILATLAFAATVVAVLEAGWGLAGLALAPWVQTCVSAGGHAWVLRRVTPELGVSATAFRSGTARELLAFSTRVFVGQFSEFADQQMDKLILGRYVGSVEVGLYHVAATVGRHLRAIPVHLMAPLLPAASELTGQGENQRVQGAFQDGVRYSWAVGGIICAGTLLLATPFMELWLGGSYAPARVAQGALLLQILGVALFLNVLSAPYTFVMTGVGRPGVLARSASIHLVLNVGLSLWWVRDWGLLGVASATLVATVVGLTYLLVRCNARLGLGAWAYPRLVWRPALAAGVMGGAGAWLGWHRPDGLASVMGLVGGAGVVTGGYLILLGILRFPRPEELAALRRWSRSRTRI